MKNKIEIFTFDYLGFEKGQWNSGGRFYNRIAKGLCVQAFCSPVIILELLLYLMYG